MKLSHATVGGDLIEFYVTIFPPIYNRFILLINRSFLLNRLWWAPIIPRGNINRVSNSLVEWYSAVTWWSVQYYLYNLYIIYILYIVWHSKLIEKKIKIHVPADFRSVPPRRVRRRWPPPDPFRRYGIQGVQKVWKLHSICNANNRCDMFAILIFLPSLLYRNYLCLIRFYRIDN